MTIKAKLELHLCMICLAVTSIDSCWQFSSVEMLTRMMMFFVVVVSWYVELQTLKSDKEERNIGTIPIPTPIHLISNIWLSIRNYVFKWNSICHSLFVICLAFGLWSLYSVFIHYALCYVETKYLCITYYIILHHLRTLFAVDIICIT